MHKVLLVYDDFTELNTIQSTLKKIGFDCVGISSEFTMSQQVLSFNPDVVIGCGKTNKVNSLGVGRRLKEMPRWTGKAVLIFNGGVKPKPEDLIKIRMDVALEAPVAVSKLVQVLAGLTGQDNTALLNKLAQKVSQSKDAATKAAKDAQKAKQDTVVVGGSSGKGDNKKTDVQTVKKLGKDEKKTGSSSSDTETGEIIIAKGEAPESTTIESEAPPEKSEESAMSDLPPDKVRVDWDEFTTELFGKTTKQANPSAEVTPEDAKRHQNELKIHAVKLGEKLKKYDQFTKNLLLSPESGLKKTETRRAQKELRKSWKESDMQSQDELRREFTKALFKQKK